MAKQIPLPRYEELPEVVLFHRDDPRDTRLLLHVPTGPDSGETHIIDLAQPSAPIGEYDPRTDHKGWVRRLPNSRGLMDKLAIEPHVAYYYSRGGTVMVLDNPDLIPWLRIALAMARREAAPNSMQSMFERRQIRARQHGPSPFRRALDPRYGFGLGGGVGVAW